MQSNQVAPAAGIELEGQAVDIGLESRELLVELAPSPLYRSKPSRTIGERPHFHPDAPAPSAHGSLARDPMDPAEQRHANLSVITAAMMDGLGERGFDLNQLAARLFA